MYGNAVIYVQQIDSLYLPSGKICAFDPGFWEHKRDPRDSPFNQTVHPGEYPVLLSVCRLDDGTEVNACAMLRFAERPITQWENAAPIDQYPVEDGLGCFASVESAALWQERFEAEPDALWKKLVSALNEHFVPARYWANVVLDEGARLNLMVFENGVGDASHSSYFGRSEQGDLAALVTDFSIIPERP